MPKSTSAAALLCTVALVCAGCASAPAAHARDAADPTPPEGSRSDAVSTEKADAPASPLEVDSALLVEWSRDPERVERGARLYEAQCSACHGAQAQGMIGPNHTDDAWLHGNEPIDHYRVIASGVPERGMPAWKMMFSAEERAELVAYLITLRGTNPSNAKDPEGSQR